MQQMPSEDALVELIDQIGQGNAQALKALYEQVSPRLFGLALRIANRNDWAEDALQEAVLTIWRSASEYRSTLSPPMAWMGLIVRSRALDQIRRHRAEREHQSVELDEVLTDTLEGDSPDPMSVSSASQQARALHGCLQQLESGQREVVSLAYLRELSHAELAESLKLPLGTVKTWIRRGLAQLRGCMARFI